MANISAHGWRLKTLRHIQVMNTRLSLQVGTRARTRRTLRTLIQARMLLTHNRLGTLREQTTRQNRGCLTRSNRHRQTVNIRARILRIRRRHQTPRRGTRHSVTVHRRGAVVGHLHHRINIIRQIAANRRQQRQRLRLHMVRNVQTLLMQNLAGLLPRNRRNMMRHRTSHVQKMCMGRAPACELKKRYRMRCPEP